MRDRSAKVGGGGGGCDVQGREAKRSRKGCDQRAVYAPGFPAQGKAG